MKMLYLIARVKSGFKSFGIMIISIFRMKYSGQSKKVENNEVKENPCQTQSEFANALTSDPTSYFCINKQYL